MNVSTLKEHCINYSIFMKNSQGNAKFTDKGKCRGPLSLMSGKEHGTFYSISIVCNQKSSHRIFNCMKLKHAHSITAGETQDCESAISFKLSILFLELKIHSKDKT